MSLSEIIAKLQEQLVALQALADSQTQYSQADLDMAVADAVAPLNQQIVALQAQVGALPQAIHDAVVAEDVALAAKVKPLVDQLSQAINGLVQA